VHLFGAQEAAGGNALDANGIYKDARFWYGHATAKKISHYHNPSVGRDPGSNTPGEDELVGWALDGYGIYGFTKEDLDECNGREVPGGYQYHVRHPDGWSGDDCWDTAVAPDYCSTTFPGATNWNYILGCYSGKVASTKIGDSAKYHLPNDCVLVEPTTVELTLSPTDAPTLQPTTQAPTTQAPTTQAPTDTSCVEGRGSCTRDNDCCSDSCLRSQGKCQVVREDCEDSATWRAVFNGELGCVWVTLDPSARCDILGEGSVIAFEECLVACEKC